MSHKKKSKYAVGQWVYLSECAFQNLKERCNYFKVVDPYKRDRDIIIIQDLSGSNHRIGTKYINECQLSGYNQGDHVRLKIPYDTYPQNTIFTVVNRYMTSYKKEDAILVCDVTGIKCLIPKKFLAAIN